MQPPAQRLVWVLLAVGTFLSSLPTATATHGGNVVEGFESYTAPTTPDGSGVGGAYGQAESGTGSAFVTTAQAHDGDQSVQLTGADYNFGFATPGQGYCGISWWVYFTAFPTGSPYYMGITDDANNDAFNPADNGAEWAAFRITTTGVVQRHHDSNGAGAAGAAVNFGLTLSLGQWYNFQINCAPTGDTGTLQFYESTSGVPPVNVGSQQFDNDLDLFSLGQASSGSPPGNQVLYLDDVEFPFAVAHAGRIFCADPSLSPGEDGSVDDFGYEYVEDWTYDNDLATEFGPTDGFVATESDGGSAYMGKGFDTGSMALAVKFTIEAAVEGTNTVFRAAFTAGGAAPSGATKGDGTDGGNFDDHIGIRFEEEDNNWRITFRQNIGGAGYNTIGSSFTHGNPNTATSYNFTVDTRDLTATLRNFDGDIIATRTIDASWQDVFLQDQWFVATGTNALLPATTVLDDQTGDSETSDGSTCIYDLIGGAEASNTDGADDQTNIPDDEEEPAQECTSAFCVDAASVPEGFTAATFNAFLGLVLVGMMTVGGVGGMAHAAPKLRIGAVVIGIFAFIGYLIAFNFGLLPLWPLVVGVALAAAVVVGLNIRGR